MSTKIKRIKKIIRNPKNVTFSDLDAVLKEFGYERRNPKGGSSHYSYFKEGSEQIITVPKRKPVKEHYVRKVINFLCLEEFYDEY